LLIDLPSGCGIQFSQKAAEALKQQGPQGKFMEMHRLLFDHANILSDATSTLRGVGRANHAPFTSVMLSWCVCLEGAQGFLRAA